LSNGGVGVYNLSGGGDSLDGNFTEQGGILEVGSIAGAGYNTTINGNFSLLAAGTIKVELTVGVADQLIVNGTVSLAGTLDLDQVGTLPPGSTFTLVSNDGIDPVVGAFLNAPNGVGFTQDGNPYTVFYNAGDGNDVILIPEPSGLGFVTLLLASSGLLGRRRRRP